MASNFTHTMKSLITEFEKNSPHRINLSSASSGKIYAQIINGAPFDLFFSADQSKPMRLQKENWIVAGSRFTYAQGQLVLWSMKKELVSDGVETLSAGNFKKLALANPRLAPYGEAANQVLKKLGLVYLTQAKWVQGENISQTFQFVRSANVELGFVALSQVQLLLDQNKGGFWQIPENYYQPIYQDAVLLKRASGNLGALAFIEFMQGEKAKQLILRSGYKLSIIPELEKAS